MMVHHRSTGRWIDTQRCSPAWRFRRWILKHLARLGQCGALRRDRGYFCRGPL